MKNANAKKTYMSVSEPDKKSGPESLFAENAKWDTQEERSEWNAHDKINKKCQTRNTQRPELNQKLVAVNGIAGARHHSRDS